MTAIVLKQGPNKIFFKTPKTNTRHENDTAQPKTGKWLSSASRLSYVFAIYHKFLPFIISFCHLTVELVLFCSLKKVITSKICKLLCPNNQHSFEPFMCFVWILTTTVAFHSMFRISTKVVYVQPSSVVTNGTTD